jgi:hypothetical protein
MPTCIANGSGSKRYDWTASHVHLYKLYRGMTAAVWLHSNYHVLYFSLIFYYFLITLYFLAGHSGHIF